MFDTVCCLVLVLLCAASCWNHVSSYPYGGGDNQWSNHRAGMMGGYPQQQQNGFGGGQHRGFGNNNFGGEHQSGGGHGHSQGRGGRQPWQSGQTGNEAYQTNVFNEPDRYGYDSTFPGATVHYLVYKKQGNRGSGNYGGNQGGWNNNY